MRSSAASNRLTDLELAWLAGLLEGEGCFTHSYRRGINFAPKIQLAMTDEDVVLRAQALMGGRVRSSTREPWKTLYTVIVSGAAAVALMRQLLPHMGERRSDRMLGLMCDWYESRMQVCTECQREFARPVRAAPRQVCCSASCQDTRNLRRTAEWKAQNMVWNTETKQMERLPR